MGSDHRNIVLYLAALLAGLCSDPVPSGAGETAGPGEALKKTGISRGICVVLGLPARDRPAFVTDLARGEGLLVYFQSPSDSEVKGVRDGAEAAGLLGKRIFADRGGWNSIQCADNLAGAILVAPSAGEVREEEILRVLHPGGKAFIGERVIEKPFPKNTDCWSHPYHGPDNNPQSTDQLARAPYLTQFLADPKFCPMPEVSVAAGGRVFRAFGHIAHKANQNPMLNTLICANAFNGIILWKRKLAEGFMIHRNAMIATPDTLYLADHRSCKLIDAETGKIRDEIVVPLSISDGPVWKWMALRGGILYALVGGAEDRIYTQPSNTPGLGHWPWGMWAGHDYNNPRTSFGFGRTIVAIDPGTKKILWNHREEEYLDSRGICMRNGRIYYYCPEKFLACLDTKAVKVLWRTSDPELLKAIGPNGRAQHYVTGYATTTYIKCSDDEIFFAGPQRSRLVAVRARDGKLLWQKPHGNYQLVLRDDGVYAAGPGATGLKLDYNTGTELAPLPLRRACTRATGSVDSIFYRTPGGTVRIETETNKAHHIAPMRPPCQDGVIISDGHLYWGPWMCGCQLSLYGHICLASGRDFNYRPPADASRLQKGPGKAAGVADLEIKPGDWPAYLGNNGRRPVTEVSLPRRAQLRWSFTPSSPTFPTAPVTAGGLVFIGDRDGSVRALDPSGKPRWKARTGGAVYFPPAVAPGRVFVGSADGRVYALEATSGEMLWQFQVGPSVQRIPVYGKLISRWPVAGGVVVQDGVVYAAAGIAHYDGTHVVALEAESGRIRWYNNTSGTISKNVDSGISLQGNLFIEGGELRFLGGGVYRAARYDLSSGRCLNTPHEGVNSRFQTAFYAYFPGYSQYLPLHQPCPGGNTLVYNVSYEGSQHSNLALLKPAAPGSEKARTDRRTDRPRARPAQEAIWTKSGQRYNGFIVAPGVLLAASQSGQGDRLSCSLTALDLEKGTQIWRQELPVPAVKGGLAVDHRGRIYVSLVNGQVLCFGEASSL